MKATVLSAAIAASCVAAVILGSGVWFEGHPGDAAPATALDERLVRIEEGLDRLNHLEMKVRKLSALAASATSTVPVHPVEPSAPESEFSVGSGSERPAEDALRDLVVQVMEDVGAERIAARQRRGHQVRREYNAMEDGPYGEHSFRMNALTMVLGLSGEQTEEYHNYIVEYNALIQEQREMEKNDRGNRERYQSRRDELREQFSDIATGILTPKQTRTFQNLPKFARRPDGLSHVSTKVAMPPGYTLGGAEALHDESMPQSKGRG